MQSDSPPEAGTTPDTRTVSEQIEQVIDRYGSTEAAHQILARIDQPLSLEQIAYIGERVDGPVLARLDVRVRERQAAIHGAIREHAQVEHPHLAWDAQAAVFTTGRFAEGRAR